MEQIDIELGSLDNKEEIKERRKENAKFAFEVFLKASITILGILGVIVSIIQLAGGKAFAKNQTIFSIVTVILSGLATYYGSIDAITAIREKWKKNSKRTKLDKKLENAVKDRLNDTLELAEEAELFKSNVVNNKKSRMSLAREGFAASKYTAVEKAASAYIKKNPNDLKAFFIRAQAYYFLGELKLALRDIQHYNEVVSSDSALHLEGNIYRALGGQEKDPILKLAYYEQAKEIYAKILNRYDNPNEQDIHKIFFVQVVRKDMGRVLGDIAGNAQIVAKAAYVREALEYLEGSWQKIRKIKNPILGNSIVVLKQIIASNLANVYAEAADLNLMGEQTYLEAIGLCREVKEDTVGSVIYLRAQNNIATYYNSLGEHYLQQQDYGRARDQYKNALSEIEPIISDIQGQKLREYSKHQKSAFYKSAGDYYLNIAFAYEAENNLIKRDKYCGKALSHYDQAIFYEASNLAAHNGAISVCLLNNNFDYANSRIERVLGLNFDSDYNYGYIFANKAYLMYLRAKNLDDLDQAKEYLFKAKSFVYVCPGLRKNILNIKELIKQKIADFNFAVSAQPAHQTASERLYSFDVVLTQQGPVNFTTTNDQTGADNNNQSAVPQTQNNNKHDRIVIKGPSTRPNSLRASVKFLPKTAHGAIMSHLNTAPNTNPVPADPGQDASPPAPVSSARNNVNDNTENSSFERTLSGGSITRF